MGCSSSRMIMAGMSSIFCRQKDKKPERSNDSAGIPLRDDPISPEASASTLDVVLIAGRVCHDHSRETE